MKLECVYVTFTHDPMLLHFDKRQKINYIAYIYIQDNQNLDDGSYISGKIEEIKHLYSVIFC